MTLYPLFAHIGEQNMINTAHVLCVIVPGTESTRRMVREAKRTKSYINASGRRTTKSIIVMDNGQLVSSPVTPRMLLRRFNAERLSTIDRLEKRINMGLIGSDWDDDDEEEDRDADNSAVSEDLEAVDDDGGDLAAEAD